MSEEHSIQFSANNREWTVGSLRVRARRWIIPLAIWMLFVLIGAADLLGRVAHAGNLSVVPQSQLASGLAIGPAMAELSNAASSESRIPDRLIIPSIGVSATVEQVGIKNGAMGVPSNFTDVAWYENGAYPGQPGNAVIDGHVNNALTTSGVFEHLDQVHIGDQIEVVNASGQTLSFTVTSLQLYSADNAPTSDIFTQGGTPGIALITCDGAWDQGKHMFNERLVVFGTLNG